jgi:hypothetical protein
MNGMAMETYLKQVAAKYQVSMAAVDVIVTSMLQSNGRAAQFNHPELGGMGQWMPGMVMIGQMNNPDLKAKVDALCHEIAKLVQSEAVTTVRATRPWWPMQWGKPSASSQQNNFAYAYFPEMNRLAIKVGDEIRLYDSAHHALSSFSLQNGRLLLQNAQGDYLTLDDLTRVDE